MLDKYKIKIKFWFMKIKWKTKNKNNFTIPKHLCDIKKIDIGNYTYGNIDAESFGCEESHLTIGHFCSIAQNVRFILDGEHDYHKISTYPFKVRLFGKKGEAICKGPIIIGDDVWIGERVIILSGVNIGQGAIIGAGSTVSKDIPPYAIFANGRIIKYRFEDKIIQKLLKVDFSKLTPDLIEKHLSIFYEDVSDTEIDRFLEELG